MPRRKSPDPDAKAIGRRIRALRKEVGLTMEKLAYESDLGSKGYLSDIEKGLALPTVKTLRVLAERLGVLPLDLLTDPDADLRQKLIDRSRGLAVGTLRKLLRQFPPSKQSVPEQVTPSSSGDITSALVEVFRLLAASVPFSP